MAIVPLAPDQTIAQMWSNGVRGATYLLQQTFSVTLINCHIPHMAQTLTAISPTFIINRQIWWKTLSATTVCIN